MLKNEGPLWIRCTFSKTLRPLWGLATPGFSSALGFMRDLLCSPIRFPWRCCSGVQWEHRELAVSVVGSLIQTGCQGYRWDRDRQGRQQVSVAYIIGQVCRRDAGEMGELFPKKR